MLVVKYTVPALGKRSGSRLSPAVRLPCRIATLAYIEQKVASSKIHCTCAREEVR